MYYLLLLLLLLAVVVVVVSAAVTAIEWVYSNYNTRYSVLALL